MALQCTTLDQNKKAEGIWELKVGNDSIKRTQRAHNGKMESTKGCCSGSESQGLGYCNILFPAQDPLTHLTEAAWHTAAPFNFA